MSVYHRAVSCLALGSLGLIFAVLGARAQSFGPYLKVDGGVNIVPDTSADIGGTGGKISFDSGYRVDAAIGYEFNRWVALEVGGGYSDNSVSQLTRGSLPARLDGSSSLSEIPLLLDVVVRYENETDFMPYVGAGAGGVLSSLKISGNSDDDAVFAWQAKAGVIYKIDEMAWIDAGYKLLVTDQQEYLIGLMPVKTKEVYNHFFGLSVVWKF